MFNIVKSFVLRQLLVAFVSSSFAFLTAYSSVWNRRSTREFLSPLTHWLANSHPNSRSIINRGV